MALFEDFSTNDEDDDETRQHYFPTHPPFLCPVEIKDTDPDVYGEGHKGVFSVEKIPKDTEIWVWTERIIKIHHTELNAYIEKNLVGGNKIHDIQLFLRQGFVFPPLLPSSFGENTDTMTTEKDTKTTTTITTTVVVSSKEEDFFYANPTDAGRFVNHSNTPNIGGPDNATLRTIEPGEELVMDYSQRGNPKWYQTICSKYNVETEADIVQKSQQQQQQKG